MVGIFNQKDFTESNNRIQGEFPQTKREFYRSKSEKIFNKDFITTLALSFIVTPMICFGIGNYISYLKATEGLKHYSPSQLRSQILESNYSGVKGLDKIIIELGISPGVELALKQDDLNIQNYISSLPATAAGNSKIKDSQKDIAIRESKFYGRDF